MRLVRSRVPPGEVEDIVQSTLADALAAVHAPEDATEFRRWVLGIARNKVADFFRRSRREVPRDPSTTEEVEAAEVVSQGAHDLLNWAERELPSADGAKKTLEWMLREGAGEKLESIAAEANVPAPRVRQRVARMRKHYRARWAAQLAAVAALLAVGIVAFLLWRKHRDDIAKPLPAPSPSPTAPGPRPDLPAPAPTMPPPEEQAAAVRRDALDACAAKDWRKCLDGLDAAKELDPAGDTDDRVQAARREAMDALTPKKFAPPPAPRPTSSATPTPTGAPTFIPQEKPGPAPKKGFTKESTPPLPMPTDTFKGGSSL